jgi:hypothetical protein
MLGESDRHGEFPRSDPIPPLMVGTTIAERAGIDAQARAEMGVLAEGKVIEGLF